MILVFIFGGGVSCVYIYFEVCCYCSADTRDWFIIPSNPLIGSRRINPSHVLKYNNYLIVATAGVFY